MLHLVLYLKVFNLCSVFLSLSQSANSYEVKVKIFKEAHPKIIGKGGAQIKKIREETDTKIDLPRENSDSDVITITGKKENVEKAKNMIEAIQKELVCYLLLIYILFIGTHLWTVLWK